MNLITHSYSGSANSAEHCGGERKECHRENHDSAVTCDSAGEPDSVTAPGEVKADRLSRTREGKSRDSGGRPAKVDTPTGLPMAAVTS